MSRRALVVDWNVEAVDEAPFTEREERGIEVAFEQYRAGQFVDQSAPPFGGAAARGQAPVVDAQQARQIFDAPLRR
jgi:hypothetical protein